MTCSQAGCQYQPVRPYRVGLSNKVTLLCERCHDTLSHLGLILRPVERRAESLPVQQDRRRGRRPAWLERLTPKDFTGAIR